ncbi:DMT family transporter [Chelativorans salis]|uniref:EamA family transporter n=1 Tax=Chelativorans salis TaxID=2978478 RepID=A0ABT2LWJ8_9HYPH|nr:EamA family transporter [Chelativorans sp. EGI FJ00035]MCT7378252.1 EamA family transporter [Chelativorans sp. EGI FJ00035]
MTSRGASTDRSRVAYILLACVSVCWAGSYILTRIATAEIPPATLATARLMVAYFVLRIWLRLTHADPPSAVPVLWAGYIQVALFGHAVPLFLIAAVSVNVPTGEMAVLVATAPLFAVALSHLFPPVMPARTTVLGLLVGALGLLAFFGEPNAKAIDADWQSRFILLGAAASYAMSGRAVAKLPVDNPVVVGSAVTMCAIAMLLPMSLIFDQPWAICPSRGAIAATMLLGTASTAVAYVIYYYLIGLGGAAFASLHHYLVPVLSALLGAACFGDIPQPRQVLSAASIVFGVYLLRGLARS